MIHRMPWRLVLAFVALACAESRAPEKRRTFVYLDNTGELAVDVSVDGADAIRIDAHRYARVELAPGAHIVLTRGQSGAVERAELEIPSFRPLHRHEVPRDFRAVYDLAGKGKYGIVTMYYGLPRALPVGTPPYIRPIGAGQRYFVVSRVNADLDAPFPASVRVSGPKGEVTRLCHLAERSAGPLLEHTCR
jgi:hypothetical protein